MKKNLLVIIGILLVNHSFGQLSTLLPEKPKWNDQIEFSYNSADSTALLTGNETVFARIVINYQDGSVENLLIKPQKDNKLYNGKFILPSKTSNYNIGYYTKTKGEYSAGKSILVYDQKNKPVSGAYYGKFGYLNRNNPEKSDSIFHLEIDNYPKIYVAYGLLFMYSMPAPYSTDLEAALKKYLPVLEKLYQKKENKNDLGILFSFCIGYAKLGKMDLSEKFMIELLEKHPESPYTSKALQSFSYDYYKSSDERANKNVVNKLKEVALSNPKCQVVYENIYYLKDFQDIPIINFEQCLLPQIEKDSTNIRLTFELVKIYLKNQQKIDFAEQLINNSIRSLLNLPADQWSLGFVELDLSEAYKLLAEIKYNKKDYLSALLAINSAISTIIGNSFEGDILPESKLLRAQIYQKLDNNNLAIKEYALLDLKGDTIAIDSLKSIHRLITNKPQDFDIFVAEIEQVLKKQVKYDLAPDFEVYDLDSNKYVLNELKGKVVVVNFWNIGCGPCVKEMPDLNKVVAKYKDNKNVIFLAFTGDSKENLTKFFEKKKFDYKIAIVKGLGQKYGVNGIPTHFIIDKNGNIIRQTVGADPNIVKILTNSIDKALMN
jgi:thiol-disulfide isomerase/thioredoxin